MNFLQSPLHTNHKNRKRRAAFQRLQNFFVIKNLSLPVITVINLLGDHHHCLHLCLTLLKGTHWVASWNSQNFPKLVRLSLNANDKWQKPRGSRSCHAQMNINEWFMIQFGLWKFMTRHSSFTLALICMHAACSQYKPGSKHYNFYCFHNYRL